MEVNHYSKERNVQILLSLLKQYGINTVIASPGSTNIQFVASVQSDSFFKVYSAPDERSAAYMACGMAAETGEPVVLSCTGATASRNYVSGLTEAYYRHLPVLAVTSTTAVSRVGNGIPQIIDRSSIQNDIAVFATLARTVKDKEDEAAVELEINKALIALTAPGGGPVHINLETGYGSDFSVTQLPRARMIRRLGPEDKAPELPSGRIAVFVGSHRPWTEEATGLLDRFCEENDAVVLCDHTSNYQGRYRVQFALMATQPRLALSAEIKLLIQLGDISGDYAAHSKLHKVDEVWRVSPDGRVSDTFGHLTHVFAMSETAFLRRFVKDSGECRSAFLQECKTLYGQLYGLIPEDLPFSNIWVAKTLSPRIPKGSAVHFGILNSLRSWNFFPLPEGVTEFSNVGGFGIDGGLSSLLGASIARPDKLFFGFIGDLAFFYDLNSLANRHVGTNVRILLVNNGKGTEFRHYNHLAAVFGKDADPYIAAAGHYGKQSPNLVRHYAEDLGYQYITASDKESFEAGLPEFLKEEKDKPVIFEVFTDSDNESNALYAINHLLGEDPAKDSFKDKIKNIVGEKGVRIGKIILGKE